MYLKKFEEKSKEIEDGDLTCVTFKWTVYGIE